MIANPYTAYKRISRGWSHEDAWTCPGDKPLWVHHAEQELGEPLHDYMQREASRASGTGETVNSVAASFDVSPDKLGHYCRKHGIRWPVGVSRYQREVATATIQRVNERRVKWNTATGNG